MICLRVLKCQNTNKSSSVTIELNESLFKLEATWTMKPSVGQEYSLVLLQSVDMTK